MYKPSKLTLTNFLSHKHSIFEFRNGKAVLVVGENMDKEGQKGNGAGKSSLNEGISVAIAGQSIRDCKPRELVRRGCECGEVELILYNSLYRCELKIRRKLYESTSKSSECKVWENNEEVTSCPDINSYNKFIWTLLGITKEDFFSFYLVTKENYTPFLTVGDGKKKEIINRFSGANVVDKTDELVKLDSQSIQSSITEEERELSKIQARQEVYQKQLTQLEEEQSDEKVEEKRKELREKIESCNFLIQNYSIQSQELDTQLESKQKEQLELLVKSDDSTIIEIESYKQEKEGKLQEKSTLLENSKKVVEEFQEEVDSIKETELSCKSSLTELKQDSLRLEKEISELENKIQGAITCPKCSHEFSLRYEGFDINEAKEKVVELKSSKIELLSTIEGFDEVLKDVEKDKEEVNNKIVKRREGIQEEIKLVDSKVFEIEQSISKLQLQLQQQQAQKQSIENDIKNLTSQKTQTQSLSHQQEQLILSHQQSLTNLDIKDLSRQEELKREIEKEITEEGKVKTKINLLIQQKQEVDEWLINFKNFKSYLANQSIKNISDYTNLFLQSLGSNITISVEGYKMMSNKKLKEEITVSVYKNGLEEGSYGTFSAGERGRIDVCCILGLQELINLNTSSGGLDLLICDEVLDSIDEMGMELLIQSLQSLERTIMIVSQNQINSLKENTIIIRKENKISTIIS